MTLVKFNESKPLGSSLLPAVDDLFESLFKDPFISNRAISRVPAVNIWETETDYHFELAAPGLKKDDFKVSLNRNMLSISVEQKMDNQESTRQRTREEFNYSAFTRSFALPDSADDSHITASYENGLLMITVPKREEARMAVRQIEIK